MRRFTSILTVVMVLFIAGSVFASGVAITGIGARATALGGNFRGIANDWSAMFWNPAGLTQIEGFHFGFSTEAIMPVGTYSFAQYDAMPFGLFRTGELENEAKTFFIPALGFVYGMGNMSFGLAVYAPFGLGAEWDVLDSDDYNSGFPGIDYEDNLQVIAIQPTFAYKFSDKLSVGLGISMTYADILIRTPQYTPNPLIYDPAYASLRDGVLAPMGLTADKYGYILTDKELAGDGWGFGANFGLKFDLSEDFSIGISAAYYNDIPLDGLINATTYYSAIPQATMAQLSQTLDGLITMGQIDEATKMAILGVYSGTKEVQAEDVSAETDVPLPLTAGIGFAYKGINNLLLSADISWTQWSSWDVIEIKLEDGSTSELVEKWEDGLRMGLGAEYTLTDKIALRGGFYTESAAPPDETFTLTIPDAGRRYAISFGGSYDFGLFTLYANYEKLLISDRSISEWVYNTENGFENMAGDFGMDVNNIMAGLNFAF